MMLCWRIILVEGELLLPQWRMPELPITEDSLNWWFDRMRWKWWTWFDGRVFLLNEHSRLGKMLGILAMWNAWDVFPIFRWWDPRRDRRLKLISLTGWLNSNLDWSHKIADFHDEMTYSRVSSRPESFSVTREMDQGLTILDIHKTIESPMSVFHKPHLRKVILWYYQEI